MAVDNCRPIASVFMSPAFIKQTATAGVRVGGCINCLVDSVAALYIFPSMVSHPYPILDITDFGYSGPQKSVITKF